MQQLKRTGDFIADDSTGTYLKVTNMGGHYSLYIRNGADRVEQLCQNFPTADSAKRRAGYLRNRLIAGATVQQLVDEQAANQAGVLAAANLAVAPAERTQQDVIARMNADFDAYQAAETELHHQLLADRDNFLAQADPRWRANLRKQVVAQANAGRHHRPLTGADAELSAAQRHALTLVDDNDEIRVQRGVRVDTLQSMARKGLGRLELGGRTPYSVLGLVLNEAGLNAAMDATSTNGAAR